MAAPVLIWQGMVFWAKPGDAGTKRPHPRIVISNPVNGKVLTVNFTDYSKHPLSTCVVEKPEHSCLYKKSCVFYACPIEMEIQWLGKIFADNRPDIERHPDLSPALLARVIAGLIATGDMLEDVKQKYGFISKTKPQPPF